MINERGFTLVELMVVVSLFALVLSFGIPAFSTWKIKHDVEEEITQLYSDLQFARLKAYSEKLVWRLDFGNTATFTSYALKRDSNSDGDFADTGESRQTRSALKATLTATNPIAGLDFDCRGFLINDTATAGSFYIASSAGAGIDCLAVSKTRITLGKWNGANCAPK